MTALRSRAARMAVVTILALLMAACSGDGAADGGAGTTTTTPTTGATADGASPTAAGAAVAELGDAADAALASFGPAGAIDGEVLVLVGRVVDRAGSPVAGAVVEIWQTDTQGVYDHPDDPGTASRDRSFQFFGTAAVDEEGVYSFRTILPGRYEPRPPHIHFKVKAGGATLLTSQFYFSDDTAELAGEALFTAAGADGEELLLQLYERDDVLVARGTIVLATGEGGELTPTPSQAEGPYYPVVDLGAYDNDLLPG